MPLHVVNVTWTDLRALACIQHFWSQILIVRRWVRSFWEATAGSLSVARISMSFAKMAMVVVGEVGRSTVYMRYSNGPRTLALGYASLDWRQGACCANMIGEGGNY
jgi:hypothetical protein